METADADAAHRARPHPLPGRLDDPPIPCTSSQQQDGVVSHLRSLRRAALIPLIVVVAAVAVAALVTRDADGNDADVSVANARAVLVTVDDLELCFRDRHGRYSGSVADLLLDAAERHPNTGGSPIMALLAQDGFDLQLDAGSTGRSYVQRLRGDGIDTYVERRGTDFIDYGNLTDTHLSETCSR
jgi:hypothetical protein